MRKFDTDNLPPWCFFVGMGVAFAIVAFMWWHAFKYPQDYAPPVASIRLSDGTVKRVGVRNWMAYRDGQIAIQTCDGNVIVTGVDNVWFGEEALRK